MRGLERWLTHTMIILLRMPALIIGALLDLLTLHQVPALQVRLQMCSGLLAYYGRVIRTGTWLSPKALANQTLATNRS